MCFNSPHDCIFLPGFFCQLIIEVLSRLNVSILGWFNNTIQSSLDLSKKIYRGDIKLVRANGIVVRCPGLFKGELIMILDNSQKSIFIAMMASKPDIEVISLAFKKLCNESFVQCITLEFNDIYV